MVSLCMVSTPWIQYGVPIAYSFLASWPGYDLPACRVPSGPVSHSPLPCSECCASHFCTVGSSVYCRSLTITSPECQLLSARGHSNLMEYPFSQWHLSHAILSSICHFSPQELAPPKATVAMLSQWHMLFSSDKILTPHGAWYCGPST